MRSGAGRPGSGGGEPVLVVEGLSVAYGAVRAVEDVSFQVGAGETLGLVGESGCGKSTAILGALRLLPPPGEVVGGSVRLRGQELLDLDAAGLRAVWGRRVALVPQGALSALNPVLRVGEHFAETFAAHGLRPPEGVRARVGALLAKVGLDAGVQDAWPHTLSGGMRQRVAIALGLALSPPLLVLDEPTTALDVVVERDLLRQVLALQEAEGFAMVFVTHDLALLLELATWVGVLYAGRLVELAPAAALAAEGGRHPYTRGLLGALPPGPGELDAPPAAGAAGGPSAPRARPEPRPIPGVAANVAAPPPGCRFHPRCTLATARCRQEAPPLREAGPGRLACWEVP